MATFNDNTLERQLSSLFRAQAQDAHLPLGTWQTISPKMGEPDKRSLFWRLNDAVRIPWAEKMWRNPMRVRYLAPTATVVLALIVALLFILLVNDDADSNDSPVPAVSPTVQVDPTDPPPTPDLQETVEAANDSATATSEAQPTATPVPSVVPTATLVPIATPTVTATRAVLPTATAHPGFSLTWPNPSPAQREFPSQLLPDSEPLAGPEVELLWIELIADSQLDGTINGKLFDVRFCRSGQGRAIGQAGEDLIFDWQLRQSAGGRWFEASVVLTDLHGRFTHSFQGWSLRLDPAAENNGQPAGVGIENPIHDYAGCPL